MLISEYFSQFVAQSKMVISLFANYIQRTVLTIACTLALQFLLN